MTLQEMKTLTAYNAWATHRIIEALKSLPEEEISRDMKSSHKSIHGTLTHLVGAEKMWLSRLLGAQDKAMITPAEYPRLGDVRTLWEQTGFATAKFIGTLTDKKLQETFSFPTSTGETPAYRIMDALQHVVDHSTYHRGQVITLMRQLGHTPPNTGLIRFIRETAGVKK